ncbi:hypothetical protein RCL1_003015 [Eukaryota sp. TZLM3-RCL]
MLPNLSNSLKSIVLGWSLQASDVSHIPSVYSFLVKFAKVSFNFRRLSYASLELFSSRKPLDFHLTSYHHLLEALYSRISFTKIRCECSSSFLITRLSFFAPAFYASVHHLILNDCTTTLPSVVMFTNLYCLELDFDTSSDHSFPNNTLVFPLEMSRVQSLIIKLCLASFLDLSNLFELKSLRIEYGCVSKLIGIEIIDCLSSFEILGGMLEEFPNFGGKILKLEWDCYADYHQTIDLQFVFNLKISRLNFDYLNISSQNLRKFHLSECNISEFSGQNFQNLEELEVANCDELLVLNLTDTVKLSSLSVSYCPVISGFKISKDSTLYSFFCRNLSMKYCLEIFENCKYLRVLYLGSIENFYEFLHLKFELSYLDSLTVLDSVEVLTILDCPRLSDLIISNRILNSDYLLEISKFKNLKKFDCSKLSLLSMKFDQNFVSKLSSIRLSNLPSIDFEFLKNCPFMKEIYIDSMKNIVNYSRISELKFLSNFSYYGQPFENLLTVNFPLSIEYLSLKFQCSRGILNYFNELVSKFNTKNSGRYLNYDVSCFT